MADHPDRPLWCAVPVKQACDATGWSETINWPTIIRELRQIGLSIDFLNRNTLFIADILRQHTSYPVFVEDLQRHLQLSVHSSPTSPTSIASVRLDMPSVPLGRTRRNDPPESTRADSSPPTMRNLILPPSGNYTGDTASSKLSYGAENRINDTEATKIVKNMEDEKRLMRLYSVERSTWIPAISIEGGTLHNWITESWLQAASVHIEPLHDQCPATPFEKKWLGNPIGTATLTIVPHACIDTVDVDFLITKRKLVNTVLIGHDMMAKIEQLRRKILNSKEWRAHFLRNKDASETPKILDSKYSEHTLRERREPSLLQDLNSSQPIPPEDRTAMANSSAITQRNTPNIKPY